MLECCCRYNQHYACTIVNLITYILLHKKDLWPRWLKQCSYFKVKRSKSVLAYGTLFGVGVLQCMIIFIFDFDQMVWKWHQKLPMPLGISKPKLNFIHISSIWNCVSETNQQLNLHRWTVIHVWWPRDLDLWNVPVFSLWHFVGKHLAMFKICTYYCSSLTVVCTV